MASALRAFTEELRANVALVSAGVTTDRRDTRERDRIAEVRLEEAGIAESQRTVRCTAWRRWFAVVGAIILVVNLALGLYVAFTR
ncbi:hypothetical protein [Micromonospora sp. NPDC005203]|uniref:hypothetical protein n=1 Tax=Micromonospora sp. NPDC005203 TaxID=3364226 RepID=UPI0036960C3C